MNNIMEKIEGYKKQNMVETLNVNLDAGTNSVIFSRRKDILEPEGKVEIQLDWWIKGAYNKINNQIEYKIEIPMKYLSSKSIISGGFYNKVYTSKELETDPLVNEIVDKTMTLLNKNELTVNDFNGLRGNGEIIHCKDQNGRKYSKLINIEVYKSENKINLDKIKKKSLEKSYSELDESDEEEIIKDLNIDISTTMGESKRSIVNSFCNQYIWEEDFMYRGYSFSSINADVEYDDSKFDGIDDIIKKLQIKPKYVECPPDYYIMQFCPNEKFHFKSWVDYLKLLISFVEYLETISIDGVKVSFREFWDDSPEFIQIDKDAKVLENVKFTKENFNFNGKTRF